MESLDNKKVLVVGGSSGIGLAIAEAATDFISVSVAPGETPFTRTSGAIS